MPVSMEEVRVKGDISPLYVRLNTRLVIALGGKKPTETERKLEGLAQ